MALNYTKGTISHMSEVTSGTSKNGYDWARQTILIDIPGYRGSNTKLSLQASDEMVDELNNYNEGDKVEVGWSIYAREWNGKWYNNVDLVNIKSQDQQTEQRSAKSSRPAPAPRQNTSSEYEVCQNFCNEKNCDYRLGTHSACARAISVSGFKDCPQTMNILASELEPQADDLPF